MSIRRQIWGLRWLVMPWSAVERAALEIKAKEASECVPAAPSYLVGERGPELLQMGDGGAGWIIPNSAFGDPA